MLQPRPELLAALRALSDNDDDTMRRAFRVPELEAELVVGPAQYRAIANRAQHFRRAFAEMFYHRSLLFLGTGLSEAYFLSLFDEALEMLGPPSRPHFALVDENKVDPDFLRAHYNIICRTYKGRDEFWRLEELLKELVAEVRRPRPQLQSWGCRMDRGTRAASGEPQFSVEGTKLPERPSSLTEVLVISVGRDDTSAKNKRGVPLLGEIATKRVKDAAPFRWINDWIGNWPGIDHLYAVAARDIWSQFDAGSRDLRSPEAVRQGFRAFLDFASANGVTLVRSMLLAAGRTRTFEPWVSLAQMARAYGEWYSCWSQAGTGEPIKVVIHVVTDDVLVQLRNGQFGLAERLRGSSEIRFRVEIIDRSGNVHVEQHVASEDQALEELPVLKLVQSMEPALGVYPYGRPSSVLRKLQFTEILKISLKNFGIVTGSTLIVNYRRHWRQGADDH
jgi:hypothetical protein